MAMIKAKMYRKELFWLILSRPLLAMGILRKLLRLVHYHVAIQAVITDEMT